MSQSASLPNLTGSTVDGGRLQIVTLVGAGAYGKLYRVIDINPAPRSRLPSWPSFSFSSSSPSSSSSAIPKVYAVKCLRRPSLHSKDAKLQHRERSFHRRVSGHPNIVTLHRHFDDEQHSFMVMDYHPRGDLFHAITDNLYYMKPALIKNTFSEIIKGVQFCHSRGVYHRDIKPENILVDFEGANPCITDFGLATSCRVSDEADCGTGSYMSPGISSLHRGLLATHLWSESFGSAGTISYLPELSDTWALSITLINLVTSMNPWLTARPHNDPRFRSFIREPNDYLRFILPISRPFSVLLARTLTLDPSSRLPLYEVVDELLKIDELYMCDEDLAHASPAVRRAAGRDAPEQEANDSSDHSEPTDVEADTSISGSGYTSQEAEAPARPLPAGLSPSHLAAPSPTHARKAPCASATTSTSNAQGRAPHVLALPFSSRSASSRPTGVAPSPITKAGKFKRFMRSLRVWRN